MTRSRRQKSSAEPIASTIQAAAIESSPAPDQGEYQDEKPRQSRCGCGSGRAEGEPESSKHRSALFLTSCWRSGSAHFLRGRVCLKWRSGASSWEGLSCDV